jgi:hypothetical protein
MNGKRYGSGPRWGIIEWSSSGSISRDGQVEINETFVNCSSFYNIIN